MLYSCHMKLSLRYDDANMWAKAVGKAGVTPAEWRKMMGRLKVAKQAVQEMVRKKTQGFLDLPFDRKAQKESAAVAKIVSKRFSDLIVLGIGGSDLGGRMLKETLGDGSRKKRTRVHFAGSSTDPEVMAKLLKEFNPKTTAINIVSKSGGTPEPMMAFYFLRDRLIKKVGAEHASAHIIATTDGQKGPLHDLAFEQGYEMLTIPSNVGGRYSVLSPVGLFPAAVMGIDTDALLSGARAAVDAFHESSVSSCVTCRYAGLHVLGAEKRGQDIQVTVPYSARMNEFGRWVKQLVAESLGKKKTRRGRVAHKGITAMNAAGPEDQHSQLQLWSEGPFDKLITFLEINRFDKDVIAPKHLGGGSVAAFTHLARKATAEALRREGRPNGTLFVERLDARTMGELIIFFELSVSLMGELMDVDAFDQPGVELMKKLLKKELGVE